MQYPHPKSIAYVDSAASDHFATEQCPLEQTKKITNPNPIFLSNGNYIVPSTEGEILHLPKIKSEYKTAQVCPENKNATLVSLGRLCDDDCLAVTNKHKMVIFKDEQLIMRAARCSKTGMYLVNLSNPLQLLNAATTQGPAKVAQIHNFTSISRLIFQYGALGGPVLSTLH